MDTNFYKIPLEELKKRGESWMTEFDKLDMGEKVTDETVSYTHLTLPTNREV